MGDFEDGAGHVAMYAKERDGGDEGGDVHVLLGGSHAGGDQAKLARLKQILSWFDNEWEISRTVRAMWQCMRKSETAAMRAAMYMYSSAAVTPQSFEFIEYLLLAMEQTDLPEASRGGGRTGRTSSIQRITNRSSTVCRS